MEQDVKKLSQLIVDKKKMDPHASFSEALVLFNKESDDEALSSAEDQEIKAFILSLRQKLTHENINWRSAAIEARYNWIQDVLKGIVQESATTQLSITDRLDSLLTHRLWGWAIFLGLMALMFFTIFTVASYPMAWIDNLFTYISFLVKQIMPSGDFRDLITDGIIPGVGGVVVFLPQILILFFFIGLLQDTGYMARAAFIMDRIMNKAGLHGKSFIPLLSSFACAIPGIMATRSIENSKDRLVTILIAPLMSCSARLPVYTLLIATLIPNASAGQKAGIMLLMYLLGIIGSFAVALILKRTLFKRQTPVFIMELPPYRLPSFKTVLLHMWERSYLFLRRAGTVILGLSIILWALMTYPKHHDRVDPSENLKQSFAGQIGLTLEPLIKPLGFDWRIGIGLVGSFAAREVFVSTMNIVFNIGDNSEGPHSLTEAFQNARWSDGKILFTPLVCLSLMVFYVFAMQCLSTIAIVYRETNGWKWPIFQLVYMTLLAYLMSWIVFQGGRLLGWQ